MEGLLHPRRTWRGVVVLLVALMATTVVAACGSSSNDDSTNASTGSTASADTASTQKVAVELIAPLTGASGAYQPWVNAAKAAVESANKKGGTQIDLKVCDSGQSANTQLACARQAVSDKAVGVMNMSSVVTGIEPILKQAGIPTFDWLTDKLMYTSPISYSVVSLGPSADLGLQAVAKRLNCQKLVMLRADPGGPGAASAYINNFKENAERLGVPSDAVSVQPGSSDMSPYVAKALSKGADCIYASGFGSDLVAMLQAAAQADDNVKLMTVPGYVTSATIKSLGPIMDRVIGVDSVWPMSSEKDHPQLKEFADDIKNYAPEPNGTDNASAGAWASVRTLADAIKQTKGEVTPKSVTDTLNGFTDYDVVVGPPVSFSKENPVQGAERMFAPYGLEVKYVNGEPQAVGDFFNLFTGDPVTGG